MPLYLENFGVGELFESEEAFAGLLIEVAKEGKPVTGYYGLPYFNLHYGDLQMILRTKRREDAEGLEIVGADAHASGRAVWVGQLSAMNLNPKDSDKLMRRVVINRPGTQSGMAVVSLVNADVLPCFAEGDIIRIQVIAFPELVEYFPDEDAYAANQPSMKDGNKFLVAEGMVFPTGLMRNRDPNGPEFESDEHLDDIVNIRGTVKALYRGEFDFGGETYYPFIRCVIDTEYGPLEIVHTASQVDEAQRKNIRVGAIVNFYGTISGDAAIFDYEKGIVRDEEHDLAALRNVFCGGDPERLRCILAENAVYFAEYNNTAYHGADEIIDRLKFVQQDHGEEYFAHSASIVAVDPGDCELPYDVGKRCLVLASGSAEKYESIAFIDVDDEGNITNIITSGDPRYHFKIDPR